MDNIIFWLDVGKIAIAVVLAGVGWFVGHKLASKNTREQKRRDLTTEHLISVYRILTNEIAHREEIEMYEKLRTVL
ncbi:MAG: hypothetical protein A3D31_11450 [Candidatus Fluviicola riflensis]|nr:MAG: hypothetical protein CHH17_15880 [Candidatus Fluviicola riflensis]OGS77605.1 MAG: hypothetical protein A3D31_11450 [Candidatus Fluviicola riflensis]OGS84188.1 MAG: hypothetical protein A3E30_12860 [Fluviicola sp. RIFCSPHIGHO2_12_FULL_43_24]OGS84671.1 MAG: hypothetical protein A2724_08385 [Fluviicola sp. RIFCSPHIGHO2_01_FULL_43_53]